MACDKCEKKDKCTLNIGRGCCFGSCAGECEGCGSEDLGIEVCEGAEKLHITDWLADYPDNQPQDIFEVRFKNTRKGYYKNVNNLPLQKDDVVAVEASPGHDIGIVSLTGDIVYKQMKRIGFTPMNGEFKKIYRKAKPYDIEKWQEAIALEHSTMIKSRQITAELGLNMKIGDVEYQGDKIKAIFYYIADERVDFRELIKILADQFKIRVEMKQIGARQEAGRIGGIGSCGRELCCASWISSFISVTTNSARYQEISLNPQKLAGQCGKLKCCLVYELDSYMDARKAIPRINAPLETLDGSYYLVKTDIFKRIMWFSSDPSGVASPIGVPLDRVKEIIAVNRRGQKVDILLEVADTSNQPSKEPDYANVVGMDSITRFDSEGGQKRRDSGKRRGGRYRDCGGNINNGERNENRERGANRSEGRVEGRADNKPVQPRNDKPERNDKPRQERAERANSGEKPVSDNKSGETRERNSRNANRPPRPERQGQNPGQGQPNSNKPARKEGVPATENKPPRKENAPVTEKKPQPQATTPSAEPAEGASGERKQRYNNRHRRNKKPRNESGNGPTGN